MSTESERDRTHRPDTTDANPPSAPDGTRAFVAGSDSVTAPSSATSTASTDGEPTRRASGTQAAEATERIAPTAVAGGVDRSDHTAGSDGTAKPHAADTEKLHAAREEKPHAAGEATSKQTSSSAETVKREDSDNGAAGGAVTSRDLWAAGAAGASPKAAARGDDGPPSEPGQADGKARDSATDSGAAEGPGPHTELIPMLREPVEKVATAPLFDEPTVELLRTRWRELQGTFVDTPRDAVARADDLVAELIHQLTAAYAERRDALAAGWSDRTDTEELRQALRRYRALFDQLLSPTG
ncbi:hypothetical protein [Nocardia arizonensis]|uniref:hypothetical protein n=1 Tax=Nocardia arizonensis TaxID=1141647 RepID=UPI0006D0CC86|nr:hypothetical protein [Nocardia arizonensis]